MQRTNQIMQMEATDLLLAFHYFVVALARNRDFDRAYFNKCDLNKPERHP